MSLMFDGGLIWCDSSHRRCRQRGGNEKSMCHTIRTRERIQWEISCDCVSVGGFVYFSLNNYLLHLSSWLQHQVLFFFFFCFYGSYGRLTIDSLFWNLCMWGHCKAAAEEETTGRYDAFIKMFWRLNAPGAGLLILICPEIKPIKLPIWLKLQSQ